MNAVPEALPDRVRARVVAYAAEALGSLAADDVPASLKRVASFAPSRRAKLGGAQILTLIESDEAFRGHIAVQARARHGDVAGELDDATATIDAAALAVLERPEGWEDLVARVAAADQAGAAFTEVEEAREQVARLAQRIDALTEELREQRTRAKDVHEKLRVDNTDLRRKLGEARTVARQAGDEAVAARRAAEEVGASARLVASAAEADTRRLRARIETLESELGKANRSSRSERDDASLRARLLLDTLLQAGAGLRQELGLPVVTGSPADRVTADLAEPGVRTPTGGTSLPADDPAMLQQLLSLPQAHLIVDGYNVTMAAWPDAPLEVQRDRLMRGVAPLVARNRIELTVVFDAAAVEARVPVQAPRGVRVLFSKPGQIADDVIRDLVAVEPAGRVVVVVTSDRAVINDVTRQEGVRGVASQALVRLISRT